MPDVNLPNEMFAGSEQMIVQIEKRQVNFPNEMFAGPEQTIIQTEKEQITITMKDAEAIKNALMGYLRASTLEDRDYLLRMTEKVPAWIDPDGFMRIGAWFLQARGSSLILTYRMQLGTPVIRLFAATLAKSPEGWIITNLREERIIPRR